MQRRADEQMTDEQFAKEGFLVGVGPDEHVRRIREMEEVGATVDLPPADRPGRSHGQHPHLRREGAARAYGADVQFLVAMGITPDVRRGRECSGPFISGGLVVLARRSFSVLVAVCAVIFLFAAPASAIVGGNDASPGEYPSVADITFGAFGCTGTLIAPDTVLSAGHCGSLTGAAVASPAAYPPQLINVRIGGTRSGEGEQVPVRSVTVSPDYLLTSGYDISILKLSRARSSRPRRRWPGRARPASGRRAPWRPSSAGA